MIISESDSVENLRIKHEYVLHSDRNAVDLGISSIKTIILMNSGALIAILAFVGQVWNKDQGSKITVYILFSSIPFLLGLVAGILCSFFAYFYQSALTGIAQYGIQNYNNPAGDEIPEDHKWWTAMLSFKFNMIASAIVSVLFFIFGMITTSLSFVLLR